MKISDGTYILNSFVDNPDENGHSDCETQLWQLVQTRKIFVGQKLHMINSNMKKVMELRETAAITDHYFLMEQEKYLLSLNFNGLYPAKNNARLGMMKVNLILRNLGNVNSRSKGPALVSMVDVIVVKKYPIYFTEFIKNTN